MSSSPPGLAVLLAGVADLEAILAAPSWACGHMAYLHTAPLRCYSRGLIRLLLALEKHMTAHHYLIICHWALSLFVTCATITQAGVLSRGVALAVLAAWPPCRGVLHVGEAKPPVFLSSFSAWILVLLGQ